MRRPSPCYLIYNSSNTYFAFPLQLPWTPTPQFLGNTELVSVNAWMKSHVSFRPVKGLTLRSGHGFSVTWPAAWRRSMLWTTLPNIRSLLALLTPLLASPWSRSPALLKQTSCPCLAKAALHQIYLQTLQKCMEASRLYLPQMDSLPFWSRMQLLRQMVQLSQCTPTMSAHRFLLRSPQAHRQAIQTQCGDPGKITGLNWKTCWHFSFLFNVTWVCLDRFCIAMRKWKMYALYLYRLYGSEVHIEMKFVLFKSCSLHFYVRCLFLLSDAKDMSNALISSFWKTK